ncbi:uncharacterized protein [Amphiura filiformis]|uniref:uncharacterized protein n=1 Tax=Amphiura filiformis TaxID=82378 RepID=UPI003B21F46C
MCDRDGQCATNQKCCSNGCGHVCITVLEESPGCTGVNCRIFCEYGYKRYSKGCNICKCQDATDGVEKPGECPVGFLPEGIVGTCVEECSSDDNCTDVSQKCCSNGCGHVCVDALNIKSECPPVLCTLACENGFQKDDKGCDICSCNEEKSCGSVFCTGHCPYGNKDDKNGCPICDCKEKPAKCKESNCSDFCEYGYQRDSEGCEICECTSQDSAQIVKEGTCPAVSDDNEAGSCADLCDIDDECTGGDKCCYNGCGHVCTKRSQSENESGANLLASSIVLLLVGTSLSVVVTQKL